MKTALRLWAAVLLASSMAPTDVQAQRALPPPLTLPAIVGAPNDLQPPSFRESVQVFETAKVVSTSSSLRGTDSNRPMAAPVVNSQTYSITGNTGSYTIITLPVASNGGFNITAYRFNTLPNTTVLELAVRNSTTGTIQTIGTAPTEVLLSNFNQVLIRAVNNTTTTASFQWQARNSNNELSNIATATVNIQQVPVAAALISQIIPAGSPATPLTEPLAVSTGSSAATDFQITSLPAATEGILALNGTAVTVNQVLTPAQVSQLTFDPEPTFFGTAVFNYRARNASGTNGPTTSYGIPVAKAICGQASTLNFATLPEGQNWQTTQSVQIEGVTITASNYTSPTSESTLQIQNNSGLPGTTLAWTTDYSSSTNNASSVDFTFSRPLDNFSIALADIDQVNGVWRDQIQLDGYTASGTLISLSAADVALAPNASNNFASPNQITGQGNQNNFGPNSNVVATFPQPIVRLRLTYRNAETVADPGGQVIGINSMSWCSVTDVYTRFTAGPVAANVGDNVSYTVEFGNNGPDAATQVERTVVLPAGATNVTGPTGATYNPTTRTINFGQVASLASGASSSLTFSFTVPTTSATYNVTASTSTPANENGQTANNTAARSLVVTDCNQVSSLNYATVATGNRRGGINGAAPNVGPVIDAVPGTASNVSYQLYTSNGNNLNTLEVNTATNILAGQSLVWQINTSNVLGVSGSASVTLVFTRPVNALTITLQDVDRNTNTANFIDQVDFDAYPDLNGGTPATLTAANFTTGAANTFSGNNRVTGTANANAGDAAGNVTATFTTPVRRLTLTYTNGLSPILGGGADRTQTLGINSITFCAQADLATTVTPVATPVNAGQTGQFNVSFTNNGPDPANNVTRQVQLPVGLTNVTATNGGTYNVTTGVVTYPNVATLASGANANSVISFTTPATGGSVTASSVTSSSASEGGATANNSATGTLQVTPIADVATTLSGPANLLAGQPSGTYTATFANNGPSNAASVSQTVTLPAGVTSVIIPNGATYDATTRVINFGTAVNLAAGTANSFQFSFTAPTTPASVSLTSNTGTATSQNGATANDQATLNVTVGGVADVATTISAQTGTVVAGQTGQFNVTFTNNGPNTANAVTRQVQLPAGLTGVTATNNGTYNATTGLVTYPATATLASGTSLTSVITFTTPANGGSVTGTSSIATADNEQGALANNSQSATISVTPAFDVATSISGPTSTGAGTLTTFNVITRNNGPSVAGNVLQTVQLPTGLSGLYISNGGTYNSATGVVTFPALTTLSGGASVNNTISFLAPTSNFTATASVTPTAGDTAPGNNTASAAATTVTTAPSGAANLFTTLTSSATAVAPGGSITFTVTQGNDGPNAATTVAQTVTLPAGLTGVTVSGGGTYNSTTGVVTFPTIASQASGTSTSYTITATAPASGIITAGASVTSGIADPMPANNIATLSVPVSPVADVATTLSGPSTAAAGQPVTYTVTTANVGRVEAKSVTQLVMIPAGLTGVTVSDGGAYNSTTGVVTFPAITTQLPGASVSRTISYVAPSTGPLYNVATVTTATLEAATANNQASVTTTLASLADVTVQISGPSMVVAGNPVAYSVTTSNNGPSAATNATTTVQLPIGLTGVTVSGGGSYTSASGLVTFPAISALTAGTASSVTNTITFTAPATNQLVATANVTAGNEEVINNNSASTSAMVLSATAQTVNVGTTLTANNTTRTPGQPITFTVVTSNAATNSATATNVVQQVLLPAGLTGVTVSGNGTYNSATGVVTFPAIASLAVNTTASNTITVNTPATGSFTALAVVSADQTDNNLANNTSPVAITVSQRADVTTTVSGPASVIPGAAVTYNVQTLNNGPSAAAAVVQTVQLPTGLTGVTASGGGTYNSTTGVVTFPTIASQASGTGNAVTNTISFTAPSTNFSAVGGVTTTTTETNATNNGSTQNTTMLNQAPVAYAVINNRTSPTGNTAGPQLIAPLTGTDADGTISSFTITSLPTPSQGVLSLNGVTVTVGQVIAAADANKLTFDPVAGFVGNAFFTYTATDNGGATSSEAWFTLPVGQDLNAVYTNAPVKGGTSATAYQNNDPISSVFDVNGGRYSSAGAILANGLATTGTNATTTSAGATQLSNLGLALNPTTGQIYVLDRTKLISGSYSVPVTTTDMYGGVTSQTVNFTIGVRPLPVTLVSFKAQASGQDAQLTWRTSQELNNAHFIVERSLTGSSFQAIGQVAGQGTTTQAHDYRFTDRGAGQQVSGPVYYRLRQVDTDGTSSLSPVEVVRFAPTLSAGVEVYPNPTSNTADTRLDLSTLPAGTYRVLMTDMAGRAVRTFTQQGGTNQSLDVSSLPLGSYIITVQGNSQSFTKRLVKE